MSNPANQKSAARQFAEFWRDKGYEKDHRWRCAARANRV